MIYSVQLPYFIGDSSEISDRKITHFGGLLDVFTHYWLILYAKSTHEDYAAMAYIAKFGDKWRAQVAKRGVRKTAVWDTKREAQNWAAKVEAEISGGKLKPPTRTLRQACDHYLETVSIHKRNAVAWEGKRFEALCKYFDGVPLGEIDSNALGRWRDFRLKGDKDHKPVSGGTVLREVNLYRNLFKLAQEEWKWIEVSPFKGVRLPAENEARFQRWRAMDIWRVLSAGRRRGGKIRQVTEAFHIALRTTFRLSEALAAPAGYDASRRVVVLPKTKTGGRTERPVPPKAAKLLAREPFTVGPNEASVLFSKLCRQLMVKDLTFHDGRGTAMTLLARKVDVMTLARISGNKDINLLFNTYYRESAEEIARRL
jgi:hypothetical protein